MRAECFICCINSALICKYTASVTQCFPAGVTLDCCICCVASQDKIWQEDKNKKKMHDQFQRHWYYVRKINVVKQKNLIICIWLG